MKYKTRVVKEGLCSYYGEVFIPFDTIWGNKDEWYRVTHECMTKWGARRGISKWLYKHDVIQFRRV